MNIIKMGDSPKLAIDGIMNIGMTRNVLLRAETFQKILYSFRDPIKDCKIYHDTVRTAAKEVGMTFGKSLKDHLTESEWNDKLPIRKKVEMWIKYDSDCWMGRFDTCNLKYNDNLITGKLKIHDSFLVDKSKSECQCIFFEGYIEGVFTTFVGVKVNVTEICCAANSNNNFCEFSITPELLKNDHK